MELSFKSDYGGEKVSGDGDWLRLISDHEDVLRELVIDGESGVGGQGIGDGVDDGSW